ncbi:hypothetical protein GCM10014715_39240 [Streptomyces spiralis]|uniref:Uncharacterized protein n=1 Tax=Streptomyces spiralis TaxID=66376 RepID=A0A919A073_9ACTN|nr:hypothetical protein [Streptomyces spiralis]GHE80047.1 hypothetical protein GCM10014715_39240 [Streptomyces spiralis]
MSEQQSVATCEGGSWKLVVRHVSDDLTIAEVWCFGAKLSETTLNTDGVVTVTDPSVHSA